MTASGEKIVLSMIIVPCKFGGKWYDFVVRTATTVDLHVERMGFCNTIGVSLTCIAQAKWLSSCGILSQLSVTALNFKLHGV